MGMSDKIEAFILELMKQEQDEWLKIQRNELAQIFGCVPSQINYVISTRFNPEKGYMVESRRGGGGCVRIRRIPQSGLTAVYIGNEIDERDTFMLVSELARTQSITSREADIIKAALSDRALISVSDKKRTRADILKNILQTIN